MIRKTAAVIGILLLSTATSYAASKENNFFVKASGALLWLEPYNSKHSLPPDDAVKSKVKLKHKNSPAFALELGSNITDEFRAGIEFIHFPTMTFKGRSDHFIDNIPKVRDDFITQTVTAKGTSEEYRKTKINSLLLNVYFDVYALNGIKLFISAGGGGSYIQERSTIKGKVDIVKHTTNNFGGARQSEELPSRSIDKHTKTSKKFSAAGSAGFGISIEVTERVNLESLYSFKILGKAKRTNTMYRGHYLSSGIRFNI